MKVISDSEKTPFSLSIIIFISCLFLVLSLGGCSKKENPEKTVDPPPAEKAAVKTPNPWFHANCLELTPESEKWVLTLEKKSNPVFKAELIAYRTSYKSYKATGMSHEEICKKIQLSPGLKEAFQ